MLSPLLERCTDLSELTDVFHMVFDANQIGITVVREDGSIIYYNDAQAKLDGLNPADVLGRLVHHIYDFTPEDSPTMRALRTGETTRDDVHYYRTRQGKLINSTNIIYPLRAGERLLGAICFITGYAAVRMQDGLPEVENDGGGKLPGPNSTTIPGKRHYSFASLIGENAALREAAELAEKSARNQSSVMLVGETGVGKEIFAQAIHYAGSRKGKPFTAVNCAAVPAGLLEGILFGTVKGAFTGALNTPGLFEETNGGTLYLDEVDSMPISLQSKMLRALQEKRIRRIGEGRERDVDVRIVSSVGKNPAELVEEGLMRPDFYYRLGVVKISIPPLRERMDDLHALIRHFLRKHSEALGVAVPLVTPEAMALLYSHKWPGNVRELEHAIEASLALMEPESELGPAYLCRACPDICGPSQGERRLFPLPNPPAAVPAHDDRESGGTGLREAKDSMEANALARALRSSAGNVALAARLLGLSPQLLHYKMKKHGLNATAFKPQHLV